jgi:hypothetical protein
MNRGKKKNRNDTDENTTITLAYVLKSAKSSLDYPFILAHRGDDALSGQVVAAFDKPNLGRSGLWAAVFGASRREGVARR